MEDQKKLNEIAQAILRDTVGGLTLENIQLRAQLKILTEERQTVRPPAPVSARAPLDPRDRDSCREN
jgi:hypothetical protein